MSTEITHTAERRMVLASGRAHPELAEDIAREMGIELLPTTAYTFANGELYVRFGESVLFATIEDSVGAFLATSAPIGDVSRTWNGYGRS